MLHEGLNTGFVESSRMRRIEDFSFGVAVAGEVVLSLWIPAYLFRIVVSARRRNNQGSSLGKH